MRIKRWYLGIRQRKDIIEFLQKNKKCLARVNWQVGTDKNGLWLFSLTSKIILTSSSPWSFGLSCRLCMTLINFSFLTIIRGMPSFHRPNRFSQESHLLNVPSSCCLSWVVGLSRVMSRGMSRIVKLGHLALGSSMLVEECLEAWLEQTPPFSTSSAKY